MANAADNYQWNADNAFQSWDLNPLAQQVGGGADQVRDTLATGRDAYLQPLMQQYRNAATAAGTRVDEGDQNLWNSQDFRDFAKTGQTNFAPQNQTPSQQWTSGPTSGAAPTGLPVTGTPPGATTPNNLVNPFFDELMNRIKQPITPDANDPTIRGQADAFSAGQTRASRNYLSDQAEKGGPYMNMQGEARLAAEKAGQNSGAFEAQLIGNEQDKRRSEIQQALTLYGGQLSDQQKLQLQEELGLMGDATTRFGISTNFDQFLRELGLRQYDTTNKWDFNWANFGAGGNATA